jgi:hypothetical protein
VLYDIYMTLGGKGLRCTFKKCKEWHRLDWSGLGKVQVVGTC